MDFLVQVKPFGNNQQIYNKHFSFTYNLISIFSVRQQMQIASWYFNILKYFITAENFAKIH